MGLESKAKHLTYIANNAIYYITKKLSLHSAQTDRKTTSNQGKTMGAKEILNPQKLTLVFNTCILQPTENATSSIGIEKILSTEKILFHKEHLREHQELIEAMLNELPETFKKSVGGGWSFLEARKDRNGNLWAGEHAAAEKLFLLGMAIKKVEMTPKNTWPILPGNLPYFIIK